MLASASSSARVLGISSSFSRSALEGARHCASRPPRPLHTSAVPPPLPYEPSHELRRTLLSSSAPASRITCTPLSSLVAFASSSATPPSDSSSRKPASRRKRKGIASGQPSERAASVRRSDSAHPYSQDPDLRHPSSWASDGSPSKPSPSLPDQVVVSSDQGDTPSSDSASSDPAFLDEQSGASSSTTILVPANNGSEGGGSSLPPPPSPDLTYSRPRLNHPFNTHRFVSRLEEAGFDRKTTAKIIMEATKALMKDQGERALADHLNKGDLENEGYLFKAALSELRTELQVRARNDAAALRSITALLQREVDGLTQKMREDINTLKHDIQLDMNSRKAEAREEQNAFETQIQELNNKFTISLGDLRTEIEQSKWDTTRRALALVFGSAAILVVGIAISDTDWAQELVGKSPKHEAEQPPKPRTADELGLTELEGVDMSALPSA